MLTPRSAKATIISRYMYLVVFLVLLYLASVDSFCRSHHGINAVTSCLMPTSTSLDMSSIEIPKFDKDLDFSLGKIAFSGLALSPESSGRRKTVLTEVVKNEVWTLEQVQGIINVNVPVRSTIIKLSGGG